MNEGHVAPPWSTAARCRWRSGAGATPGITRPAGRAPYLPPQGWTDGRDMGAPVAAYPARQEYGLLPFSLLTTLPG